jgi:hypothetical protein
MILLPQPGCWAYRQALPHLALQPSFSGQFLLYCAYKNIFHPNQFHKSSYPTTNPCPLPLGSQPITLWQAHPSPLSLLPSSVSSTLFMPFHPICHLGFGNNPARWAENLYIFKRFFFFLRYWGLNSGPSPRAPPPVLFLWRVFEIRSHRTICPGWLQIMTLLISASWVARIIGMRHRRPLKRCFNSLTLREIFVCNVCCYRWIVFLHRHGEVWFSGCEVIGIGVVGDVTTVKKRLYCSGWAINPVWLHPYKKKFRHKRKMACEYGCRAWSDVVTWWGHWKQRE